MLQSQRDEVVKEEEAEVPVKKTGKRRKQKARKGINIDKTTQDEFNNEREAFVKYRVKDASSESEIGVDAIPTVTKPPTIVNWKIISQSSQKAAYQIIKRDGSDKIYISFGAILKDFSRDDLIELYRLVIKKYGENRPEEMYDRVLWGDLKTMFVPLLSDDAIWSLPLQQKIINWRYYPTCAVHCLTLDASNIYMLADRKYPLSKDACQVMLKMKLLDGTMDGVCYQLLKMIEKQAGIRKHKNWLVHKQTACGKDFSNPLMVVSLPKTIGPNILPLGTFLLDLFILAKDGLFIQFDVFLKLKASPYWHKEGCLLSGVPASNALATGPKFIIKGCLAW
ncbi:hypothetical protein Tco_1209204 [Tanacetum coccineum]